MWAVVLSAVCAKLDAYKMQKVKVFVNLYDGVKPTEETKLAILEHFRKHIAKYAMLYDIEFCDDTPKMLVGTVAYRRKYTLNCVVKEIPWTPKENRTKDQELTHKLRIVFAHNTVMKE